MKVIPNLKYTDKHEWVKIDGEFAYIGITAYAQTKVKSMELLNLQK